MSANIRKFVGLLLMSLLSNTIVNQGAAQATVEYECKENTTLSLELIASLETTIRESIQTEMFAVIETLLKELQTKEDKQCLDRDSERLDSMEKRITQVKDSIDELNSKVDAMLNNSRSSIQEIRDDFKNTRHRLQESLESWHESMTEQRQTLSDVQNTTKNIFKMFQDTKYTSQFEIQSKVEDLTKTLPCMETCQNDTAAILEMVKSFANFQKETRVMQDDLRPTDLLELKDLIKNAINVSLEAKGLLQDAKYAFQQAQNETYKQRTNLESDCQLRMIQETIADIVNISGMCINSSYTPTEDDISRIAGPNEDCHRPSATIERRTADGVEKWSIGVVYFIGEYSYPCGNRQYKDNENFSVTFEAPENFNIQINITYLDTEEESDFLNIYEKTVRLKHYSGGAGKSIPTAPRTSSRSNKLRIEFTSDGADGGTGFRFRLYYIKQRRS